MQKRYYTKEFKLQAVNLSNEQGNVSQVAEQLGIRADILSRWKREYSQRKNEAFAGSGVPKQAKDKKLSEIQALKKQVRELQLERDILKKAVGIFSKNDSNDIGS